jgi:hypothetical protein
MKIVICCSASFYRQANDVEDKMRAQGYELVVPSNAEVMRRSGDYDVEHYKTWFGDDADYHKKAVLMREHFDKVSAGDVILVLNYEKQGQPNYIGGNVLMEMAIAFYLNKPIYILNDVPAASKFLEEILGMAPIVLHGDLGKLTVS